MFLVNKAKMRALKPLILMNEKKNMKRAPSAQ